MEKIDIQSLKNRLRELDTELAIETIIEKINEMIEFQNNLDNTFTEMIESTRTKFIEIIERMNKLI